MTWALVNEGFVPYYADAGLDTVITSLVQTRLSIGQNELLREVNANISLPKISAEMLLQYIIDRQAANYLLGFSFIGTVPDVPATVRPPAPAGFGANASGLWFSTPNAGVYNVAILKNGRVLRIQPDVDLSVNRTIPIAILESPASGDIIQLSLIDPQSGAWGWFGRYKVA